MNIRTNLRNARKDTIYVVAVARQGKDSQYIYAELVGTAQNIYIARAILEAEEKIIDDECRIYSFKQDADNGITNASLAVAKAIELYAKHFNIDL